MLYMRVCALKHGSCAPGGGRASTRTMSVGVKQFRLKFRAASLFLSSGCCAAERVAKSGEQAAALCTLLSEGLPIKHAEHDELCELVLSTAEGWESSDRLSLVQALARSLGHKRREEQKWAHALLGIFTEEEWTRLKAVGPTSMDEALEQIIARVQSIGGKNLCEYSKKMLTAIWLHLRGDGLRMNRTERSMCQLQLKSRLARKLRGYNPVTYIETLDLEQIRQRQPAMYLGAYGASSPCPVPCDDQARILYLDGLMQCRGVGVETCLAQQGSQSAQALVAPPQHQDNGILEALGSFMQQMLNNSNNSQQNPNGVKLQMLNQPQLAGGFGRPMRSIGNVLGQAQGHPPPASPRLALQGPSPDVGGDARDEIAEVAAKMLKRGAHGNTAQDHDHEDGSEEESELPAVEKKKKKKKNLKASKHGKKPPGRPPKIQKSPAKRGAEGCGKSTAKVVKSAKTNWPKPPSIGWEKSRSQVGSEKKNI